MSLKFFLPAMIIILLTSFVAVKTETWTENTKPRFKANAIMGSVESFECNEFVWEALNYYTIDHMKHDFGTILTCVFEPVINLYNPDVTDTIYSFSNDRNEIRIYKARENSFVFTFTVSDPIFKLNGNIYPGMSKNLFASMFNIYKPLKDSVIIKDSDDNLTFQFLFKNGSLAQITSDLYLD